MIKNRAKHTIDTLFAIAAMFICLFCAVAMSACSGGKDAPKTSERLYHTYLTFGYPSDGEDMYAYVMLSGKDEDQLEATVRWNSKSYAKNVWYNVQDVEMTVDSAALCKEISELMTEDMYVRGDVTYKHLKIVFRYDTIYKSISSDADSVVMSGGKYVHMFVLDKNSDAQKCNLHLTSQNAASWYTMLIACVIIFAVILLGVTLAVKGKLWQKKMKKSE